MLYCDISSKLDRSSLLYLRKILAQCALVTVFPLWVGGFCVHGYPVRTWRARENNK